MTDDVVMKRMFTEEIYPGDGSAKELLRVVENIVSKHGEDAEVYLEDEALCVYITRPETDHEREMRIKNEERVKSYRYRQFLNLKAEFEPESA